MRAVHPDARLAPRLVALVCPPPLSRPRHQRYVTSTRLCVAPDTRPHPPPGRASHHAVLPVPHFLHSSPAIESP